MRKEAESISISGMVFVSPTSDVPSAIINPSQGQNGPVIKAMTFATRLVCPELQSVSPLWRSDVDSRRTVLFPG
jgi:hypothetical protein